MEDILMQKYPPISGGTRVHRFFSKMFYKTNKMQVFA